MATTGIISSNMTTPAAASGQVDANGNPIQPSPVVPAPTAVNVADPTKWTVDPKQTTQGQIASMIDPNSPLYQSWATAGKEKAAGQGFTNGSMEQSGILNSVMQNATPIATSDANTMATAGKYNADTQNTINQQNANAANTMAATGYQGQVSQANTQANNATSLGTANISANTQLATANISANTQLATANISANTQLATANISADTQKAVAQLSSDTQQKLATMNNTSQAAISSAHDANAVLIANNSAATTAFNNYIQEIANIDASSTISDKAGAEAKATTLFQNAMNALKSSGGTSIDLTGVVPATTLSQATDLVANIATTGTSGTVPGNPGGPYTAPDGTHWPDWMSLFRYANAGSSSSTNNAYSGG